MDIKKRDHFHGSPLSTAVRYGKSGAVNLLKAEAQILKATQISSLRLHCMQLLKVAKRPLLQQCSTLEQKANPRFVFASLQDSTEIVEAGRYV